MNPSEWLIAQVEIIHGGFYLQLKDTDAAELLKSLATIFMLLTWFLILPEEKVSARWWRFISDSFDFQHYKSPLCISAEGGHNNTYSRAM